MANVSRERVNQLLHFINDKHEKAQATGDKWSIDADAYDAHARLLNAAYTYDVTFDSVLSPQNSIRSYVQEIFSQIDPITVLDLFGSGKFATKWKLPVNVLGLRSKDIRTQSEKHDIGGVSWQVHECNIFDCYQGKRRKQLKKEIEAYLSQWGVESFNLLTCRPFGPFENSSYENSQFYTLEYLEVYYQMFQFFYELLSNENGTMLTMLPQLNGIETFVTGFFQSLIDMGCKVSWGLTPSYLGGKFDHVVRVVKTPNAVLRLPDRPACITLVD